MKLEFEITYDAGKLAKQMKKIIKNFLGNSAEAFEKGSKEAIERGSFKPIGEFTKIARKEGLSPNAGKKGFAKTSSTKPLQHSKELLKSIKALPKSQILKFNEYGRYHLGKGSVFAKGEVDIGGIKEKSGTAYKVAKNKFSSRFGLVGKDVPIRYWFKYDKETGKKGLQMFQKEIKDNFERKMSQKFTRFKA